MTKRLSTQEFVKRAKVVHGDKYEYDDVIYINNHTKVKIFCKNCKEYFYQVPLSHLAGNGCEKCSYKFRANKKMLDLDTIISRFRQIHKNKYDYSNIIYTGMKNNVKIVCNSCGNYFLMSPANHLKGEGCPYCNKNFCKTTKQFISEARLVHGDDYDYRNVIYKNNRTPVEIICKQCGNHFFQTPDNHLRGQKCPKCAYKAMGMRKMLDTSSFIMKSTEIHKGRYDYSKSIYSGICEPVKIICNKCHRMFTQIAHSHLMGCGCPYCKQSKGELAIIEFLDKNKIDYEIQKRFTDCKNIKPLPFDFYLPKYNLCIEYQGEQHYKCINFFGGEKAFELRKKNDEIKKNYCELHKIKLLEIHYNDNVNDCLKICLDIT